MDKFECETILPSPPVPIPKTDVAIKLELGMKDQQTQPCLMNIENKENIIDGNLLPAPVPIRTRSAAVPNIPWRAKADVRTNY